MISFHQFCATITKESSATFNLWMSLVNFPLVEITRKKLSDVMSIQGFSISYICFLIFVRFIDACDESHQSESQIYPKNEYLFNSLNIGNWQTFPINCQNLASYCQILVTNCPSLTTDCHIWATSCQILAIDCQIMTTNCQTLVTSCQVLATNCQILATNCQVLPTKCQISRTNCYIRNT